MMQFSPMVWPLAILVVALIFRRDVSQALGRIGHVRYRDLELTFRDDLRQAEQLARALPPTSTPAGKGTVVLEVSRDAPEPLVGRLIVAPDPIVMPLDRPDSPEVPASRNPREDVDAAWGCLVRASNLKRSWASDHPEIARLVGLLRTLRERAVRPDAPPPSSEDARRFVDLANRVASRIQELG